MSKENKIRTLYIIILVGVLLYLVSPFLISIFFAGTVALTMYPLHERLVRKGLKSGQSAGLLTFVFAVIISIPLSFFIVKGTVAVTQRLETMAINEKLREQGVQQIVTDIRQDFVYAIDKFSAKYEFLEFLNKENIDQYLGKVVNFLLTFFKSFASALPTIFILLLIMFLCTYSFLTHAQDVKRFFQKITGFSDSKMDQLCRIFISDSRQVYLSNIITGGIQSLMVATGVRLLGLGDFFLVFFVTLILAFIPVVGAAPVAFVFALMAFFIKENITAAIILGILGLVTGIVDNILRPWLASFGRSHIPPVVAFVCVIGGALWFGFPGLFIGLLVGSIAYDTLPLFWDELDFKK